MNRPAALFPPDDFSAELEQNVHPRDWTNPRPADRYHLLMIGGASDIPGFTVVGYVTNDGKVVSLLAVALIVQSFQER